MYGYGGGKHRGSVQGGDCRSEIVKCVPLIAVFTRREKKTKTAVVSLNSFYITVYITTFPCSSVNTVRVPSPGQTVFSNSSGGSSYLEVLVMTERSYAVQTAITFGR